MFTVSIANCRVFCCGSYVEIIFMHIGLISSEWFRILSLQVGVCNASIIEMGRQGSRDRLMLWHISRTAKYIKTMYSVSLGLVHLHLRMCVISVVYDFYIFISEI